MAKVAIVNDKDEIIGSAERSDARKSGQLHRIVRVMLLDGKGNILLQKRHPQAEDSPNKWDFSAAGHVDEGEGYEFAAKREVQEELGLDDITLQPLFKFYAERVSASYHIRRFNMVFMGHIDPLLVHPDLDELGGVEWFTKSQVEAMLREKKENFTKGFADNFERIATYI
jgi:16S rRNA (adenine1518-N6/adenine1519-N6)-dimethyltransferase